MHSSCYKPHSSNENSLWPKLDDHLRRSLTTEFFLQFLSGLEINFHFCRLSRWDRHFVYSWEVKPKQLALFNHLFHLNVCWT